MPDELACPEPRARPEPCAIVLFGATGDLTRRKLIPAFYSLFLQGLLPDAFAIVAFARRPKDDAEFRSDLRSAVEKFAPSLDLSDSQWDRFAARVFYLRSTLDDAEGYQRLKARLEELDRQDGLAGNRLFYLATPPENFSEVIRHLGEAGMADRDTQQPWARIVVEKPFGTDLETARALNRELREFFAEEQVYRIDHYLGKETVQNILVLRFANRLFELLWNHLYIDNVQITVAETLGVEGRGAYFDKAGILRDMVQNHALQLLTLIAMEPPVSLGADHIRDEKVKVLRSIRRIEPGQILENAVRAQYARGDLDGESVPSYADEEGVPRETTTETYAAVRFWVDNWRWAGVPFYVRAAKRMPRRVTKLVIQLREVPDVLFSRLACAHVAPNRITIRIQPDEGVELLMGAKEPGPSIVVSPVRMDFSYREAFGRPIPDAYERLLLNALLGDASLFARDDEVDAAWSIVTPILRAWESAAEPPDLYRAGTWGPRSADALLAAHGRRWWNE